MRCDADHHNSVPVRFMSAAMCCVCVFTCSAGLTLSAFVSVYSMICSISSCFVHVEQNNISDANIQQPACTAHISMDACEHHQTCVSSHHIPSHRVASHRIASHPIASHRIASPHIIIASHRIRPSRTSVTDPCRDTSLFDGIC